MRAKNIAVLISGNGSNLQALIDVAEKNPDILKIILVISNKKDAFGLTRAKTHNIKSFVVDHKMFDCRVNFDMAMHKILLDNNVDIICLAGFMRILSKEFIELWPGKILNIHPSLLPSFKGVNAIEQAFEYGVKITGCSVHFVIPEVDCGKIIVQKAVEILPEDDIKSLTQKIHIKEHEAYKEAILKISHL